MMNKENYDIELFAEEINEGPEAETVEENLSVEGLDLANLGLVRIDMNVVEYPLFSRNSHRKKNQSIKYYFNNNKDMYIKVYPTAGDYIPGELEEKVFIILLKIMKRKGFSQTFYVTSSEIFAELETTNKAYYNRIKKALLRLSRTHYDFKNTLYLNKLGQTVEKLVSTSMLDLELIELSSDKKLRKTYNDSRIKEVYKITISDHFYENIIRKGYMVYDAKILLDIENSVSRALYMLLTKIRFEKLHLKLPSLFLIKRIPLKYDEKKLSRTIETLDNACKDLLLQGLIKSYNIIKNKSWKESEIEFYFDPSHNELKQLQFYEDKNYFNNMVNNDAQLLISHTEESSTLLKEVKEELKEKNPTEEDIKAIVDMLPSKAKTLKTLPKNVKEWIRDYGFKHISLVAEYVKERNPSSIITYFSQTLQNGWAEEYISKKQEASKIDFKASKKSTDLDIENSDEHTLKEILEGLEAKFIQLNDVQKSEVERAAYQEYIKKAGGVKNPVINKFFEHGKRSIILKYLNESGYLERLGNVFEEKKEVVSESKIVEKNKDIEENTAPEEQELLIEEEYEDVIEFKFEVFEQLNQKISQNLLKNIMDFLEMEHQYRGKKEGYRIELKFVSSGKSRIFLQKLN